MTDTILGVPYAKARWTRDGKIYKFKLRIADVIIQLQGRRQGVFSQEDCWGRSHFIYRGHKKPDIILNVELADKFPDVQDAQRLFVSTHPMGSRDRFWDFYKKDSGFILRVVSAEKSQAVRLNARLDRGTVYLKKNGKTGIRDHWLVEEIIFGSLQIILINYLAGRKAAILHAAGIRDIDGTGRIFIGKSGAGKSTIAKFWHKMAGAAVLNDDRVIITKKDNCFFIFATPWQGNFLKYPSFTTTPVVPISALYFIHHDAKHTLTRLSQAEAFEFLYPNLFFPLWRKEGVDKILSFCGSLLRDLPCFKFGFLKDKSMIDFIRSHSFPKKSGGSFRLRRLRKA